ncbi:hypothetical protein MBLNU457_g0931t1 [Dothideomycetes sp. NU457]
MPLKRKRSSLSREKPNKAPKHDCDRFDLADDDVYLVKAILDENENGYLIHWAPDKKTGQKYPHEWTAKDCVNQEAIDEWERSEEFLRRKKAVSQKKKTEVQEIKRGRGRPRKIRETHNDHTIQDTEPQATPLTETPNHRKRRLVSRKDRKIIPSSPESTEDTSSAETANTRPVPTVPFEVDNSTSPENIRSLGTQQIASIPPNPFSEDTPSPVSFRSSELDRGRRVLQIRVSPLRDSQKALFETQTLNSSPFRSSQVLSGTQPAPEDLFEDLDEPQFIDNTTAAVYTQQDSEYQPEASKLSGETTASTIINSSSAVHTFPIPVESARTRVIPDSQSLEYPTSYEPSTQSLPVVVPESSAVPPATAAFQEDSTTESAIEPAELPHQLEDNSSVDEEAVIHIQSGQAEAPSPEADTVSSTSSPPPTESPGKSTQSQSLPQSQPQSQPQSHPQPQFQPQSQPEHQPQPQPEAPRQALIAAVREAVTRAGAVQTASKITKRSSLPFFTQVTQEEWEPPSSSKEATVQPPAPPKFEAEGSPYPTIEPTEPLFSRPDLKRLASVERQASPGLRARLSEARRKNGRSIGSEFRARSLTQILNGEPAPLSSGSSRAPTDKSSPLRSAPSQWPDTLASAPPRPLTPSDFSSRPATQMTNNSPARPTTPSARAARSSATPSLRERLASVKPDRLKMANKDGEKDLLKASMGIVTRSGRLASPSVDSEVEPRSPSAVPHTEEVPVPSEEEGRTSERYPTLVPQDPNEHLGSSKAVVSQSTTETQSGTSAKDTKDDMKEFLVPVYFSGQQRDHYRQTVMYFKSFLEEFRTQIWPANSTQFLKAVDLVKRLHQVCLHPDLNNEEAFSQSQIDPKGKAQWDIDTSAKFRFLETLLNAMSEQDKHVILFVQDNRLLEILDVFLTGINVQHMTVLESQAASTPASGLFVTILPISRTVGLMQKADLIIILEGAFQIHEQSLKALRSDERGILCPLLTLVVPRSVEHIERVMQTHDVQYPMEEKLSILVETMTTYRNDAGLKTGNVLDARQTAAAVAGYLTASDEDSDGRWPLDGLGDMTVQYSLDSQTTSGEEHVPVFVAGMKRTIDNDAEEQQSKRTRVDDMPMTINPADISITHISDTMGTQPVPMSQHTAELEALRLEHQREKIELQDKLQALQARLDEHVTALEGLQYRFEDQRSELVKATSERDEAQQKVTVLATQVNNKDGLIAKTRLERDEFREQLLEARKAVLDHSVPERVELEALKTTAAEAEKERAKAESRVKSMSNDLDYIRGKYQDASNSSTSLAEENKELTAKLKDLEQKASGEMTRAKQITKDTVTTALQAETKRLKLILKDRETLLTKKDEEITRLKEAQRGRMGTRGSSVPPGARSPVRLQSPMRLEPPPGSNLRAVSPARAGRASPVPGSHGKSKLGR